MCRLIIAHGNVSSTRILDAAVSMSRGETAHVEAPTRAHPDGWGAVWRPLEGERRLSIHRDMRPIAESCGDLPLRGQSMDFLVVHVRHATLAVNQGLSCTHPLERPGRFGPWYFLHNGFLPTVYQRLGRERSVFDSAEYFDYLVSDGADVFDRHDAATKLRALPAGGTSGNAVLVNSDCSHVIHWTPEGVPYRGYFTMHRLIDGDCTIIASDVVESLAPPDRWTPLEQRTILSFRLGRDQEGEDRVPDGQTR